MSVTSTPSVRLAREALAVIGAVIDVEGAPADVFEVQAGAFTEAHAAIACQHQGKSSGCVGGCAPG